MDRLTKKYSQYFIMHNSLIVSRFPYAHYFPFHTLFVPSQHKNKVNGRSEKKKYINENLRRNLIKFI